MQSNVEVRYATLDDVGSLVALFGRVVEPLEIYTPAARAREIGKYTASAIRSLIEDDACAVAVAHVAGTLAGFTFTEDQKGPIWIRWYGVNPDNRGQGVGKAMLTHLIASAPNRDATRIWCDTRTDNLESNGLLKKLGFAQLCELRKHWHGQDYYLWALDL